MEKKDIQFSNTLISLFKGVVSSTTNPKIWNAVLDQQIRIEDYISRLGLTLVIHNQDGYAYLKQKTYVDEEYELPRLVSKRQLGYTTSFLLVIMRKEFVEINRSDSSERLILSESEIIEKMRPYLKDTTDEVKQRTALTRSIKQIEDMGFIKKLKSASVQYEILPLVRGFVDAQWLEEFNQKLEGYINCNTSKTKGVSDEPI